MLPASEFQDQNRAGGRWGGEWGRMFAWVHVFEKQGWGTDDANFLKVGLIVVIISFPGNLMLLNGSVQGSNCFFAGVCAPSLKDAQIHLERRTMTVQQKVTVTIFLIQVQHNGPLSLSQAPFQFSLTSFVCLCVCVCVSWLYSPTWVFPCVFTILVCAYAADMFVCGWCFDVSADSLLQQVFAVRFLGSMAVRCGDNQEVIYEAMRQVLAARAIHNIFRTTESHLMVTSSNLR